LKNNDISLQIFGGGQEIGANSYLLKWGTYNIILDSGLNPKKAGYEALPAFDLLHEEEVDAVIISHAHLDHIGSLPFLVFNYLALGAKVFMTPPNKDLIPQMLKESVKALERGRIPEEEQYYYHQFFDRHYIDDLTNHNDLFCTVDYDVEFEPVPGVKASFFQAGHILGSSGVTITDDDYTFVYTGDICYKDQAITPRCSLPNTDKTHCLLIESTHGFTAENPHRNLQNEYHRLADEINKTIERGGHVLIPCFGLGRTQELVVMISQMKNQVLIPKDTPVFYHQGTAGGVNQIYDQFHRYLNNLEGKKIVSLCEESNVYCDGGKLKKASELSEKPAIFVYTSGMMVRRTPSALLAAELVQSEKNGIFFCGYIAPGGLGYELANIETGQFICVDIEKQSWVRVVCPHVKKFSFSAHASRQELLQIAEHFNPDIAVWVHGDVSSAEWLEKNCATSYGIYSYSPHNRETIALRIGSKKINRQLKEFKAVLVTVGTSMLTSYLAKSGRPNSDYLNVTPEDLQNYIMKNLKDLPLLSAETNSLNRAGIDSSDFLYFICGDSSEAQLCGNILKDIYNDSHICRLIVVEGLRPHAREFKEKGMKNLLEKVIGIIQGHDDNASIHATGGFKAQIALATLLGILFKNDVYYLYEDFQEIVSLPKIPLGFDYQSIFAHEGQFFTLLDGREYWKMDEIYARLPAILKHCFYNDTVLEKYILTPLGRAVFNSFQRYIGQKVQDIPFVVKGESALWGKERDSISKILNPIIGILVERLNRYQDLIEEFEFSSINKEYLDLAAMTKENYLELVRKEADKLVYQINHMSTRKGIQDMLTISTAAGASSYLLGILGRKIYP